MSTNRTALLLKIHKVLKKHYKPVAPPADRTVLDHLLYACCLENARYEAADEAFAKLKELYFDLNEIRVTTVTEISEGMSGIPDAAAAAQRVKRALQSVFESNYSFDLEALQKQNLGKAEKDLEKIQGTTPFVRAYVTQNALAGHSIPVSRGAIEVLCAVGAISDAEADKQQVPGMERAIPKNKGVEFGSLLQQIGADFYASPGSSKLKSILGEIDADYKDRLVRRQAKLEQEAAEAKAAAKEKRQEARAAAIAAREQAAAEARQAAAKAAAKAARGKGKSFTPPPQAQRPPAPAPAPKSAAEAIKPRPPETRPPESVPKKKDEPSDGASAKKAPAKGLAKKKPR
jgi:endonuclease-3